MRRCLYLLALALTFSSQAWAQDKTDRPLITVSGQAEINVTPDMAVFYLRVVTLDKDLARSKTLNDESVRRTLTLAKSYGIAPEDVQTSYINVDTQYSDDDKDGKPPIFLGYQVTKSIVLILRDMSRVEGLLSDVIKAGVNRVGGVVFRTTQLRKYKDQARKMAIRAAQEKAIAMTQEIGQTIGKAFTITEEGFTAGSSNANNFMVNSSGSVGGDDSGGEGTIAIGQIPVTARVVVSFELK